MTMPRTAPLYTQHQAIAEADRLAWSMHATAARIADLLQEADCCIFTVQSVTAAIDRALMDVHQGIDGHRRILELSR
jgi:hypothetical protein